MNTTFAAEDSNTPASTASLIGIGVAIAGNVVISFALNCQKLAHKKLEEERKSREAAEEERSAPVRSRAGSDLERQGAGGYGSTRGRTENRWGSNSSRDPASQPLLVQPAERNHAHPGALQFYAQPITNSPNSRPVRGSTLLSKSSRRLSLTASPATPIPEESSRGTSSTASISGEEPGPQLTQSPTALRLEVSFQNGHTKPSAPLESTPSSRFQSASSETEYLKSKLWWSGFILLNVGELGNFLSYAFAPASVVAPLGTFALIANCFFAPLMLKEEFRRRDLWGIFIAIVGAVTVVIASKSSDVRLDPKALLHALTRIPFLVYLSVSVASACFLAFLSQTPTGQRYVFIDVGLCALFGGFTVLSTKALSTILSLEWIDIFKEWITYPLILTLIGTGVGQIRYLNRALMSFDSKIVVPIQFVFFNLSAIVGSAILYRDFDNITFHRFVVFLYGIVTTFLGVIMLTWRDEPASEGVSPPSSRSTSLSRPQATTPLLNSHATPILRNRNSTASIGLSPAYLLLATTSGSPSSTTNPLSGPLVAVPIRQRTRSESRRGAHQHPATSTEWESRSLDNQSVRL
ncbi:hypothetical protein FRC03_012775 [Tulasnella sp. 419]|nr:hypothetical protein FRC03_012775 [Tulasnella sp. 419]